MSEGAGDRRIAFVVGSGRSGTSTMSGTLQALGMHVPQPEVGADATNPKGFGEPKWIVELHERLLNRVRVQTADARPQAWFDTERPAMREIFRNELYDWLEGQFAEAETPTETTPGTSELVVKDPRLVWFLGMWRGAAIRCRATPTYITMLRPVTEVVGSKQKYYAGKQGEISRTAGWVNVMLHTERATRDSERAFVRYADLLDDWTRVTMQVGETLGLQHVLHARSEAIRDGHRFVDPGLRRVTQTLEDLQLPPRLHELTAETWSELNKLADPGGDTPAVHAALDDLREAYVDLYEESAAISRSSVVAAEQRTRRQLKGEGPGAGDGARNGAGGPAKPPAPAPTTSLADRVPHELRAKIPPSVRRGLRRALGRTR